LYAEGSMARPGLSAGWYSRHSCDGGHGTIAVGLVVWPGTTEPVVSGGRCGCAIATLPKSIALATSTEMLRFRMPIGVTSWTTEALGVPGENDE
jgi:hypothetical protein